MKIIFSKAISKLSSFRILYFLKGI